MDDYIKRNEAIEEVRKSFDQSKTGKSTVVSMLIDAAFLQAGSILRGIPAADVRPVVRGKWIQTTLPMGWEDDECAECSVCGEDFVLDEWSMDDFTNTMNFCPNCGADMRGERDV